MYGNIYVSLKPKNWARGCASLDYYLSTIGSKNHKLSVVFCFGRL